MPRGPPREPDYYYERPDRFYEDDAYYKSEAREYKAAAREVGTRRPGPSHARHYARTSPYPPQRAK